MRKRTKLSAGIPRIGSLACNAKADEALLEKVIIGHTPAAEPREDALDEPLMSHYATPRSSIHRACPPKVIARLGEQSSKGAFAVHLLIAPWRLPMRKNRKIFTPEKPEYFV